MLLDDRAHNRQAHAESFVLRRREGLDSPVDDTFPDPSAVVDYGQLHRIPFPAGPDPDRPRITVPPRSLGTTGRTCPGGPNGIG